MTSAHTTFVFALMLTLLQACSYHGALTNLDNCRGAECAVVGGDPVKTDADNVTADTATSDSCSSCSGDTSLPVLCSEDSSEPNDSLISPPPPIVDISSGYANIPATVCGNNLDYFKMVLPAQNSLRMQTSITPVSSTLNVALLNCTSSAAIDGCNGQATSLNPFGCVIRNPSDSAPIEVCLATSRDTSVISATELTYITNLRLGAGCNEDTYAPNHTELAAFDHGNLNTEVFYSAALCPFLEDWFRFRTQSYTTLTLGVTATTGLLAPEPLALTDCDGGLLGITCSIPPSPPSSYLCTINSLAANTDYCVRVHGSDAVTGPVPQTNYTLNIKPGAPCGNDPREINNNVGSSSMIPEIMASAESLQICNMDEDWFRIAPTLSTSGTFVVSWTTTNGNLVIAEDPGCDGTLVGTICPRSENAGTSTISCSFSISGGNTLCYGVSAVSPLPPDISFGYTIQATP